MVKQHVSENGYIGLLNEELKHDPDYDPEWSFLHHQWVQRVVTCPVTTSKTRRTESQSFHVWHIVLPQSTR